MKLLLAAFIFISSASFASGETLYGLTRQQFLALLEPFIETTQTEIVTYHWTTNSAYQEMVRQGDLTDEIMAPYYETQMANRQIQPRPMGGGFYVSESAIDSAHYGNRLVVVRIPSGTARLRLSDRSRHQAFLDSLSQVPLVLRRGEKFDLTRALEFFRPENMIVDVRVLAADASWIVIKPPLPGLQLAAPTSEEWRKIVVDAHIEYGSDGFFYKWRQILSRSLNQQAADSCRRVFN